MTYLNLSEALLLEKGAQHTAREIASQPVLWKETSEKFYQEASPIAAFLKIALAESDQIILTGAGTSSFIGLSLQGALFTQTGKITRAIATTDIVSHPLHYFQATETILVISFARSGKSPESCAALELADKFCKKCFHLIITCNEEGALAAYKSRNPVQTFVLPPDADDKSLAMTGSYTSMLLVGLLLAYIDQKDFCQRQINAVIAAAEKILKDQIEPVRQITQKNFQRAVFLGSGPLFGTAKEAALKLQELTDGQIVCQADTYLGFRHGPKAVIDENTLVVYFFSNSPYVKQYEKDLLHAMKTGNRAMIQLGVSEEPVQNEDLQVQITLAGQKDSISEDFLPVFSIIAGQLIGFFKSLAIGLMPDAPSVSGSISRVVQGVNIYPVKADM